MAKRKKPSTSISVNFKGVEGKGQRIKPGEYEAEVKELTQEKGDKADYLKWVFELEEGGVTYFNTSLSKQSLWNLRGLLEALGEEVPDDEMDIDFEELIGKKVMVVIEEEEYEGKNRPKMVDYYAIDAGEPPSRKGREKGEDKKTKDEIEEMDRDDLEEFIKENDLSVDPDDYKKDKKLLAAVIEELEGNDYFEEKSSKKGKKKAKKLDKLDEDDVLAMDQEELEDVIKKYDIDVDLEDYKTLKKMAKAVAEALSEASYIED